MSRRRKPVADDRRFRVHVWDDEGDVRETLWEATADEVDALREKYRDDPRKTVVADEI